METKRGKWCNVDADVFMTNATEKGKPFSTLGGFSAWDCKGDDVAEVMGIEGQGAADLSAHLLGDGPPDEAKNERGKGNFEQARKEKISRVRDLPMAGNWFHISHKSHILPTSAAQK